VASPSISRSTALPPSIGIFAIFEAARRPPCASGISTLIDFRSRMSGAIRSFTRASLLWRTLMYPWKRERPRIQ
jgi:hypothetical protein